MVKKIETDILRKMNLSDLKKHAKRLKRGGYEISGYSKLKDTAEDLKILRRLIRSTQKKGKIATSTRKSPQGTKKSTCDAEFDNLTQCNKKTSVEKVKQTAKNCGIDYTTKQKTCVAIMESGLNKKTSSKSTPKESTRKKSTPKKSTPKKSTPKKSTPKKSTPKKSTPKESSITETKPYIKLNKMSKRSKTEPSLIEMARTLGITHGNQDKRSVSLSSLRKHELILAILDRKKKRSPIKNSPVPKKSTKRTQLISKIVNITGKPAIDYIDYKYSELKDELEGLEVKTKKVKTKKVKTKKVKTKRQIMIDKIMRITGEDNSDDLERYDKDEIERLYQYEMKYEMKYMIKKIIELNGDAESDYDNYNTDEIIDIYEIELRKDRESFLQRKAERKAESKYDTDESESEPDDSKYDIEEPDDSKYEVEEPDDSKYEVEEPDDSKYDIEEPEEKEPDSDTDSDISSNGDSNEQEIVDVESTLASVISGGNKIGELAKVQTSILKCLGLLS
jgi:hypothetical protein